jgi:hypothetical protein
MDIEASLIATNWIIKKITQSSLPISNKKISAGDFSG